LADQYYIRIRGRVQGPFDSEKLRQLARRGQFSRLHEVSTDGQQWQSAKDFPELFAPVAVPVATASTLAAGVTTASPQSSSSSGVSGVPTSMPAVGPISTPTWYYAYAGREQGPVDFSTLANLFATRQLQPEVEVWNQGMAQWVPASSVAGLVPVSVASGAERTSNGQPVVSDKSSESSQISHAVTRVLAESRPWVIFIAVIGFIYAALLLLGGILQIIFGSRTAVFLITATGLLNMVLAVVVSFGAWLLVSYVGGISHVERSRRDTALCSALSTLKTFWVYVGIVLIVVLTMLVLLAIVILSMAGSIPDFN
jgi:hypothetical protein